MARSPTAGAIAATGSAGVAGPSFAGPDAVSVVGGVGARPPAVSMAVARIVAVQAASVAVNV